MTAAASNLVAIGFAAANDGVLHAAGCRVELAPIGKLFYEMRIDLGDGNSVSVVVHKIALKINRERPGISIELVSDPKLIPADR